METATVLVVDDDAIIRDIIVIALEEHYRVITAESGQRCLELLQDEQPDLVLLDVEMAGMNGYETCALLKSECRNPPPVMFVSAHDGVHDRLKGYDAGGDDYITKPFEQRELLFKVAALLKPVADRNELEGQVAAASSAAMTAMTSMGEMGVLLEALKRFHACNDLPSLARASAAAFDGYELHGVLLLRGPGGDIIRSTQGRASPMEMEAIRQVAEMGRIVEFKSRMSVSYEHITLLFNNMPVHDPDRYGRLRDHLAILAEGIEAQIQAILRDEVLERVVAQATRTLADVDETQRRLRAGVGLAVQGMTDLLEKAYISVALTEGQEKFMAGIVQSGVERILNLISDEQDTQQQLTNIVQDLQAVARRA